MMNLDGARAGGEGMIGVNKKPKKSPIEMGDKSSTSTTPPVFESDEQQLKISVPDGWLIDKRKKG